MRRVEKRCPNGTYDGDDRGVGTSVCKEPKEKRSKERRELHQEKVSLAFSLFSLLLKSKRVNVFDCSRELLISNNDGMLKKFSFGAFDLSEDLFESEGVVIGSDDDGGDVFRGVGENGFGELIEEVLDHALVFVYKLVHAHHVLFLLSESPFIGDGLQNFGYQYKHATLFVRDGCSDEFVAIRSDDSGTNVSQKQESSNHEISRLWEPIHCTRLQSVAYLHEILGHDCSRVQDSIKEGVNETFQVFHVRLQHLFLLCSQHLIAHRSRDWSCFLTI